MNLRKRKSVNEESTDHTERTKNLGNGLAEQKNDSALPSKRRKKPSKNDTQEKGNVFSLKSPNKKKELKDVAAKEEILSVKSENKESTKLISKTHHLVGISEHIEKEYIPEKKYRGAAKSSKKERNAKKLERFERTFHKPDPTDKTICDLLNKFKRTGSVHDESRTGCPSVSEHAVNAKDVPVSPPLKYESLGAGPTPLVATGKKYIGCHVSAAGGIWTCFENGEKSNASAIAMFLRNQRSWNAKPLNEDSIEKWNEAMKDFPRHLILPHGSYLMNLGSPKQETLEKSRQLLIEELQRCEKLGIPHFNFHPGSTLGEMSREECCKLVAESINLAHKQTSKVICVIENMSKQGFTVGGDLHEIRLIIEAVEDKSRVGVCIDTCHAHAAGYDLASEKGFNEMVGDFEKIIGWQFLRALHINDSKGKVGDHKDRHENIGKGFIGREGFRRIMNCPRFNDVPLILETPFASEDVYGKEIKLLQKLIE